MFIHTGVGLNSTPTPLLRAEFGPNVSHKTVLVSRGKAGQSWAKRGKTGQSGATRGKTGIDGARQG